MTPIHHRPGYPLRTEPRLQRDDGSWLGVWLGITALIVAAIVLAVWL